MRTDRIAIVGGGHAGVHLVDSLRSRGFDGAITLINGEAHVPYARHQLSKGFLAGGLKPSELALVDESWSRHRDIEFLAGCRVSEIDVRNRSISSGTGETVGFDHLVLATGARPSGFAIQGAHLDGVVALRSLDDARELRTRLVSARNVVVVGGGFVGLEVAAAATQRGAAVTVLEPSLHLGGGSLSPQTAEWLRREHLRAGERVLMDTTLAEILGHRGEVVAVKDRWGQSHIADVVVMAAGARANTELATQAGLAVSRGIVVDRYLATSHPGVSAIGDCVAFVDPAAGKNLRLPSVQNAMDQADCLAARLTGAPEPYEAVPRTWSIQGSITLQVTGRTEGAEEFIVRGEFGSGSFSVFCFRAGDLVAVESVNSEVDQESARSLLVEAGPVRPSQVAGHSVVAEALL